MALYTKVFVCKTPVIPWNNLGGIAYVYRLTSHDLRGNKLWLGSHLEPRYLLILHTWLPLAEYLCISWKNIPLRYLSKIVYLSRYAVVILDCHSSDKELSY